MTFAAGKCGEAQAEGAAYIPCYALFLKSFIIRITPNPTKINPTIIFKTIIRIIGTKVFKKDKINTAVPRKTTVANPADKPKKISSFYSMNIQLICL